MALIKYIDRIKHIDRLLRKKSTGDLECFAKKLNLSRSTALECLKEMKELGFPIQYSKNRRSYFYKEKGKIADNFFIKDIPDEDLKKINGGQTYFQLFPKSEDTGLWHDSFVK